MPRLRLLLLPIALFAAPLAANADDWNDGDRRYERPPREVFWDGNCRVERYINRDGDQIERRRCRGDRYADERAPRRYPEYRDQRQAEPEPEPQPEPVVRYEEPPVRAPRIVPHVAPVMPAAPRVVAQAAPVAKARIVAAKPAPVVVAPRVVAKAAPVVKGARVVANAAPAVKPARVIAKAIVVAKPVRVVVKAPPAVKHTIVLAKAAPKVKVVATVTKVHAVPKPLVAKVVHKEQAVRIAAEQEVVAVVKAEPVAEAPTPVKTQAGNGKADWLVTLSTDQAKADAVVKAPLQKAPPSAKHTAMANSDASGDMHDYDAYVMRRSKERYSNLK